MGEAFRPSAMLRRVLLIFTAAITCPDARTWFVASVEVYPSAA